MQLFLPLLVGTLKQTFRIARASILTAALTAPRNITLPDRDVDLGTDFILFANTSAFGRGFANAADNSAGRSLLGLGDSATYGVTSGPTGQSDFLLWRTNDLVKQTSTADSTAGRVMLNGAHGIGNVANPGTIADLASVNPGGLYRVISTGLSMPAGWTGAAVAALRNSATTTGYLALQPSAVLANLRVAVGYYNGTSIGWNELWGAHNLVKQTGRQDMTVGSVLLNGAHGLGEQTTAIDSTLALLDRFHGRLFSANSTDPAVNPFGVQVAGITSSYSNGTNRAVQICGTISGTARFFGRMTPGAGAYGAPVEFWHTGNLELSVFGKSLGNAANDVAGRALLGLSNAATIVADTGSAASTIPLRDGSGWLTLGTVYPDFMVKNFGSGSGLSGGRFYLQKGASAPGNNAAVDLYNNTLRFYDTVTAAGFYLDLGEALPGVGAKIWHSGNLSPAAFEPAADFITQVKEGLLRGGQSTYRYVAAGRLRAGFTFDWPTYFGAATMAAVPRLDAPLYVANASGTAAGFLFSGNRIQGNTGSTAAGNAIVRFGPQYANGSGPTSVMSRPQYSRAVQRLYAAGVIEIPTLSVAAQRFRTDFYLFGLFSQLRLTYVDNVNSGNWQVVYTNASNVETTVNTTYAATVNPTLFEFEYTRGGSLVIRAGGLKGEAETAGTVIATINDSLFEQASDISIMRPIASMGITKTVGTTARTASFFDVTMAYESTTP